MLLDARIRTLLSAGAVIPAHPLALTPERRLDERRQRALTRYYVAAGAGGIAVGVHTTQFAIRDPRVGLFDPLLEIAGEELDRADRTRPVPMLRVGGICGRTPQAVAEAERLSARRFHAGLLSLAAFPDASDDELIAHCREVAAVIPIFGFYLQPAVGGRVLPYSFWRRFVELDQVVAIKVAPFNRYQTLDVVRAVADAGRPIPLYTGNDDNIVGDLVTAPFVGGLLGHWAVWTRAAVDLWSQCRAAVVAETIPSRLIETDRQVTDANAAFFDAANGFTGCIAGLHEVLRRQGLLAGTWLLDPSETLSPGQASEIDRVCRAYPHLNDDEFVRAGLDDWLRP
jgi:dihydrodipicolinate synthase/N-acetylneuraminate lyase